MEIKISIDEAKAALKRSGYLIESRIEAQLLEFDYLTHPNILYKDSKTGKGREIDLLARKQILLTGPHTCELVLIIECANNPQPIAFLSNGKRKEQGYFNDVNFMPEILKVSSNNFRRVKIKYNNGELISSIINESLALLPSSHYFMESGATQYCSFKQKNAKGRDKPEADWMAWHDPEQYDMFSKFPIVLQREIERHQGWIAKNPQNINISIFYPVLILQGELWEISESDNDVKILPKAHIHFIGNQPNDELNIETIYYHVDVLREDAFANYLKMLDRQLTEIEEFINSNIDSLMSALSS